VADPARVTGRARESWKEPRSMLEFAVAIKDAMQNWRDNAQARMPGYRERVVHIKLAPGEGGLNLAMDEAKVSRLIARGDYAGERLSTLFSGPESEAPQRTPHWNDHRFARFRIVMSAAERFLQGLERGYRSAPDTVTTPYPERIAAGTSAPYKLSAARLAEAQARLAAYLELAEAPETLDDDDVPRPRAAVRVVPPL
jgi:hypothetical protein